MGSMYQFIEDANCVSCKAYISKGHIPYTRLFPSSILVNAYTIYIEPVPVTLESRFKT